MRPRLALTLLPPRRLAALLLLGVLLLTGAAETGAALRWGAALRMEFWQPPVAAEEDAEPVVCGCAACPARTTLGRDPALCCCTRRALGPAPDGMAVANSRDCPPMRGMPQLIPPSIGYVFLLAEAPLPMMTQRFGDVVFAGFAADALSAERVVPVPPPEAS